MEYKQIRDVFNWFTSIRNLHSFDTGRFKPLQAYTRMIATKQYLNNFTIRYFKSVLLTNGMNTCQFFFPSFAYQNETQ